MQQLKILSFFVILLLCAIGCNDRLEEYYEKPDWIKGPIYKQLQDEGRFGIFLACLDKTIYSSILNRTGYFTVFAPNDEAFAKIGITSAGQLDTLTIKNIVSYAIVNYGYTPQQLAAYQSPTGWQYGKAYKRQTRLNQYFTKDSVEDEKRFGAGKREVYIYNNKNKCIPYFIDEFFKSENLSAVDYNTFYPTNTYTGLQIANANVVGKQLIAENGYIYELDKVIYPLNNIDEELKLNQSKFSKFREILEKVAVYTYDSLTSLTFSIPVYTKSYTTVKNSINANIGFIFDPTNENWMSTGISNDNPIQTNGWTLFAPDNDAIDKFVNEKLGHFNYSIEEVFEKRPEILMDFVNAHMFNKSIWPGRFASNEKLFGVSLPLSELQLAYAASNGFLYGINKWLETGNLYNSIYGELCLNPEYTIMYIAVLRDAGIKNIITNRDLSYTLILTPDSGYNAVNYMYNDSIKSISEKTAPTTNAIDKFKTVLAYQIIRGDYKDLSGSGYLITNNDGYIKYNNNKLWGYGNVELNKPATILESINTANNGTIFVTDLPVMPPTQSYLTLLSTPPAGISYSLFNTLLQSSSLIFGTKIQGLQDNQPVTIFVPTDAAINANGFVADPDRFIQNHIVPGKVILADGSFMGKVKTLCIDSLNGKIKVYTELTIGGKVDSITITDKKGNVARLLNTKGSNVFSTDNAVIHQIDKVLKY